MFVPHMVTEDMEVMVDMVYMVNMVDMVDMVDTMSTMLSTTMLSVCQSVCPKFFQKCQQNFY